MLKTTIQYSFDELRQLQIIKTSVTCTIDPNVSTLFIFHILKIELNSAM